MEPSFRLPLSRPPFWTARTFLFSAIPAVAYILLPDQWTAPLGHPQYWLSGAWLPAPLGNPTWGPILGPAGVMLPLLAFGALVRRVTRVLKVHSIEATDRGLIVPCSAESSRWRLVPYRAIDGIEQMARGRKPVLLIATNAGPVVLPLDRFEQRNAAQQLRGAVQARLLQQPGGASHLATMAARSRQALALAGSKPQLTRWLLGLLGVIFFYELWVADGSSQLPLLRLGGNARALVQQGQWQRLISANFLHAGALHWVMNGLGLAAVGGVVERLLGWHRLAVIYSVSGVVGALSSTLWGQADLSVGASGAIFGLLGSLAVLSIRDAHQLPLGVAQSRQTWWTLVGLNAVLPVVFPQIDWVAHVGGAVAGALSTLVIAPRPTHPYPSRQAGPASQLFAYAWIGLTAFALLWALPRTAAEAEADWTQLWSSKLLDPTASAGTVNRAAWMLAVSPTATKTELTEALDALDTAVNRQQALFPGRDDVLDTLATLNYRLGRYEEALRLELDVLQRRRDSVTEWQVARFAHARLTNGLQDTARLGEQTSVGNPYFASGGSNIQVQLESPVPEQGLAHVRVAQPLPLGAEVWVSVERGGRLIGMRRIVFPATNGPTNSAVEISPAVIADGNDLRLSVALVDARPCSMHCPRKLEPGGWLTPDPLVAGYP